MVQRSHLRSEKKRFDLQQLQQLERLERLEQLERLERLERLEIHLGSYEDYEYQEGDVVYCDPPYECAEHWWIPDQDSG